MSTKNSGRGAEPRTRESQTLLNLAWLGVCTGAAIAVALLASQFRGVPGAIGIGSLILLTAGAIGAILGFLFALPRVLTKDQIDKPAAPTDPAAPAISAATARRLLGSNTNLERVSDWLTTMIVGVGLTQLGNVNTALLEFRQYVEDTAKIFPRDCKLDTFCNVALHAGALPVVSPLLLIMGLAAGFVGFYLFTRLKLSVLFLRVEKDLDETLPREKAEGVKEVVSQRVAAGDTESVEMQAVLSSAKPSVDDTISLMYSLLYRTNGYQQVIDLGGQLSGTVATSRPSYWFYLAAAFGQKYSDLLANQAPKEALQSARDNALDSARRAVLLDPFYKQRLLHISDPDGGDNDLADLRNDPDFLKIVGQKPGR